MASREMITEATAALFTESVKMIVVPDESFSQAKEIQAAGAVVGEDELPELPVIDMARLADPESSASEIAKLGSACREWGFFQLTNHGMEEAATEQMKESAAQFFSSPIESKNTVAVRDGFQGFGHHFRRGSKLTWAECLILITQPVQARNMDLWPATNPPTFRHALDRFSVEIRNVARRLVSFMATDLGVSQEALLGAFFDDGGAGDDKGQSMVLNYYPPWRQPGEVVGIQPHTDTLGLTLLLPVDDTPGLQVKRGGRWFPVRPMPGALVVNVGDILDILTNGAYVSAEHRVVPDAERGRISVVMVQDACVQGLIKPLPELLLMAEGGETQQQQQQPRYRSIPKLDYAKGSVTGLAQGGRFADTLRI